MFDTKVEKCKKDVVKFIAQEKELTEALKEANAYVSAVDEARAAGSATINSAELAKVKTRIADTESMLRGTISLLEKAKQKLYQALTEQRQSDEAEISSLYKSMTDFRKDRLQELAKALVETQVLLNLSNGEAYGIDLMQQIHHMFRHNDPDARGPDQYMLMVETVGRMTKERYQKSPMAKRDMLVARINSHKELSIIAEAEKLLSSALEEAASTTKEDSGVTG